MRSKPDYVLIFVAVHKGLVLVDKSLKFSPNRVSNSLDIPDMYKCHQNKC